MAWTREDIVRVFTEHGHVRGMSDVYETKYFGHLIDALLSLQPPAPTRESLDAILKDYNITQGFPAEPLRDRLMAWAMGQPEKHFWCSHMVYRRREDGWDGTGWVLEAGAGFEVKENWAVCPVCAAPRPKES